MLARAVGMLSFGRNSIQPEAVFDNFLRGGKIQTVSHAIGPMPLLVVPPSSVISF